ncbi:MAG: dockerin type I domain-containing protein [Candidatus Aenigmatarchaeota archaeon]
MKQAFIDVFNHTVSYLSGTDGIWAWAILNEPWYNNPNEKENFIDLFKKLSNIVRNKDGRPVTIRFANAHEWLENNGIPRIRNIFVDDWGWDQRILDALDFISFNVYLPEKHELYLQWKNILEENIFGCLQRNKTVWIAEFGFSSNDDNVQATNYKKILDIFKTLPIKGVIAWHWQSPLPQDLGKDFDISKDVNGNPRLAYYELIELNKPLILFFYANPNLISRSGQSLTLSWVSFNTYGCISSSFPPSSRWQGSAPIQGTSTITNLTQNMVFLINCSGPRGSVIKEVYINLKPSADVNNDGKVDINDIVIVAKNFGKRNIDTSWNPFLDIVQDGEINIYDLVFVGSNFSR